MRDNFLQANTGSQGSGKTHKTFKTLLHLAFAAEIRRKGLIIDVNGNEFAQKKIDGVVHKIKTVNVDNIIEYGKFKGGDIRRVPLLDKKGIPMSEEESEETIIKCLTRFRDGLIFFDDLNKIYGDALPTSISSKIVNLRHMGIDLIISLQSVGRIVPKIYQNVKFINYFYQLDSISKSAGKLSGEEEIFLIAEKLVNTEHAKCHCPKLQCTCGFRYFNVIIDREDKLIQGPFSNEMFTKAIMAYLAENEGAFRNYTKLRDISTGKPVYNYNTALMAKAKDLFYLLNGNIRVRNK